jgi:hypothetical protein
MKLKSYEREYDEDLVSEIEEMMPDISSIIINAGINLVEKNNIEVTPKSVENAIKRLVSSIMKYYMTQNLPNVNESYDKAKNFLKDNFGIDFTGLIKQITSSYDVPKVFFDEGVGPTFIRMWLNHWGPMYLVNINGKDYLYQDRGDFEMFIDEEGFDYVDGEVLEEIGIGVLGLRFSDILDMYFEED